MKFLRPYADLAYAAMRLVIGSLFACHGAQKLFGWLGGTAMLGNPKLLLGGGIEFVCGLLVAVGLQTSLAAFLASGEMAYAYFSVHAPQGFWPIQNKGELAVAYCFVFLAIAARGSGAYSVDRSLGRT
jgi:putative oxidoreductase